MKTRITFNGQEYASPESMPPEVRRAYEEALSSLAAMGRHAARDSALLRALLPRDHSEPFLRAHYTAQQSAARILPVLLALVMVGILAVGIWLFWPVIASPRGQTGAVSAGPGLLVTLALAVVIVSGIAMMVRVIRREFSDTTASNHGTIEADELPHRATTAAAPEGLDPAQRTLGPMLAFMAGFVLVFAIGVMLAIGGGREHMLERFAVAIPALLFLGWLDTHATRLARRRESLLAPDSPGYRRFLVWSGLGLLISTAVLLGIALFLPS